MIVAPDGMSRFEFVRIATLRAVQLLAGSVPRVTAGCRPTVTALQEVMQGKVCRLEAEDQGKRLP
jgi:DNA-directed RNA polymerase subunit K/omega